MNNIVNQIAFLRTSREFPEELHQLTVEINKAYIDTANVVNNRIISIFPVNKPARNGENWYFANQRQEGFRQVYNFTILPITINVGFLLSSISKPTRCWGEYTDAIGNSYGLIWASSVPIAGQISLYLQINPTPGMGTDLITFLSGAGAPTPVSGFVVIEWISQV